MKTLEAAEAVVATILSCVVLGGAAATVIFFVAAGVRGCTS